MLDIQSPVAAAWLQCCSDLCTTSAWLAQVVGRVHKGIDVLDTVSDLPTNHNDLPQQKLVVSTVVALFTYDMAGPLHLSLHRPCCCT
jgi:hypothetical protein